MTYASRTREQSTPQIASKQDATRESQTSNQTIPAFLSLNDCFKTNVEIATGICARDYKGFGTGTEYMNGVIYIEDKQ